MCIAPKHPRYRARRKPMKQFPRVLRGVTPRWKHERTGMIRLGHKPKYGMWQCVERPRYR